MIFYLVEVKVKLSYNGRTKEYIVSANTDNSIKDSIYMINENNKILYVSKFRE